MVLGVIGGVGVLALTIVANQYQKALASRPSPARSAAADASRLVDGFLAARRAARAVAARYPGDFRGNAEAVRAYRSERFNAFAAHGMTLQDYLAVRVAWRALRAGDAVSDPGLAAAFGTRPTILADGSLGELEGLDDAIQ